MAKLYKVDNWEPGLPDVHFHCPGCNCDHGVWIQKTEKNNDVWSFNNNDDKPTFSPSILVKWVGMPDNPEKDENGKYILDDTGRIKGAKDMVCHSFVRDGMIQFLGDCTHKLAGQTVELPEIN
jgi:hypothetical protein